MTKLAPIGTWLGKLSLLILTLVGLTILSLGLTRKYYDCADPRNQCTNYPFPVSNCAIKESFFCEPKGCQDCLIFDLNYRPECLPPDCNTQRLSLLGILMVVIGVILTGVCGTLLGCMTWAAYHQPPVTTQTDFSNV